MLLVRHHHPSTISENILLTQNHTIMKRIFTLIVALMAIATSAYSFVLEVNGFSVTAANGHNIPYVGIHNGWQSVPTLWDNMVRRRCLIIIRDAFWRSGYLTVHGTWQRFDGQSYSRVR